MSELPDRPDLDQLRRQARELLRAAADGEPSAVARLRVVSERVTLSAAQLAVAREHGWPSWPALRAEVERRRLLEPPASQPPQGDDQQGSLEAPKGRWSFGGATNPIEIAAGVLWPEALIIDPGHAVLDTTVTPTGTGQRSPAPGRPLAPLTHSKRIRVARAAALAFSQPRFDDVTVVDDGGANYTLHVEGMWGGRALSGEPAGPMCVSFWLDPVPDRGVGWIELRSQDGAATRLLPSARPAVQTGQLTPAALSPAEQELPPDAA